jgi:hypothetical protein
MKTSPNKLWIIVIALGWAFDFLFWNQELGVNFAIFAMLCLTGAFYLLLSDGLRPNRASLILLLVFGLFAAVTFIRAEPMTTFLAFTCTLLMMTILALTYLGGRWMHYSLADYAWKSLGLFGNMLARPTAFSIEARRNQQDAGTSSSKFNFWPVVRGIAIAVPVVAIFAGLLSSADVVFGQRVDDFMELFKLENLPEYIFRSIYILVAAYALAGVILHAATESKDEKLLGVDKPLVPAFLGFIESGIILGSVVALFAAFVVIQFQYFFGGDANINVEGYTYSEYAVRGFSELVFTAFLALCMLLGLSSITKRERESQRRVFSGLGVILVGLLLVMLVSAFQRLSLYESVYGFSRLRTYTHVFLVWLGLLLVATIILEVMRRERAFTVALLVASLGFAASLPILNVDAFIVRQNIAHEIKSVTSITGESQTRSGTAENFDEQYLTQLSDDAVPALVAVFNDKQVSDELHEQVGVALACIRHERGMDKRKPSWQSFHFAQFTADRALAEIKTELDQFQITDEEWPTIVTTPAGAELQCWPDYYD